MAGHRFNPAKADKLVDANRFEMLPPQEVLSYMQIEKGEIIADLGAGNGFFTLPLAQETEEIVYAVDIEEKMLHLLHQRANQASISSIAYIIGELENTHILQDTVDHVLIGFVMHEVPDRKKVISEVKRILKDNGSALLLEWEAVESEMGPPLHERLESGQFARELESYGCVVEKKKFNEAVYGLLIHFK